MNRQEVSIQNLENKMGQLANAMNNQLQGTLRSDTEINPKRYGKELCRAVTLISSKELLEAVDGTIKKLHGDDGVQRRKLARKRNKKRRKQI